MTDAIYVTYGFIPGKYSGYHLAVHYVTGVGTPGAIDHIFQAGLPMDNDKRPAAASWSATPSSRRHGTRAIRQGQRLFLCQAK
ncbi:hypothetical protein MES4922_40358 [Mesorhizobium ventifaucium]|uniref:Uncharacterized protein n=1 Tax=Mesorhizobium ventifaucium TaxID=666020 RepID=A0ABN8K7Q7_9HYPH|nr:hypothetical protein MES4922_40358 [Mesorhizobium ventifaucium]